MKTTIIFHSADFDGLFCREIARKFLPEAELIGWDFKDKILPLPPEGMVYVLDLPVDRPFGLDFATIPGSMSQDVKRQFIWIDHHASSIASHPTDIPGYRIDGVAACRLAWQWFTFKGQAKAVVEPLPTKQDFLDRRVSEPLAVRLAGEYDVWTKGPDGNLLPDLQEFQHGLRSRKLTDEDWDCLLQQWKPSINAIEEMIENKRPVVLNPDGTAIHPIVTELLQNGRMIQGYANGVDASTVKKASFLAEFEGLKVIVLNTARCNSLTFAARDVPETGHDALLGYYNDGRKYHVSLYHAKHRTDLDLSQIAKKHGGGGHRGACGFQTDTLLLKPL